MGRCKALPFLYNNDILAGSMMKFPVLSNLLALCAMVAQVTPTIAMEQSGRIESEKYDDAALAESRQKVDFLIGEASNFLKLRTENIVVSPETFPKIRELIHDVERIEQQFTFSDNRIPDRIPNNLRELKEALQGALGENFWDNDKKFATVKPLKHCLEGALLWVFGSDVRTAIYNQAQQAPLAQATLHVKISKEPAKEEVPIFRSISSQPDEQLDEQLNGVQEYSVMSKALDVNHSLSDFSILGSEEQILASRKLLQANGQLVQLKKRAETLLAGLPEESVNRREPLENMLGELSKMLGSEDGIKTLLSKISGYQNTIKIIAENPGEVANSYIFFSPTNNNASTVQLPTDNGLQASVCMGKAPVTMGPLSLGVVTASRPLSIKPSDIMEVCNQITKTPIYADDVKNLLFQALFFSVFDNAKAQNVPAYSSLLPISEALRNLHTKALPVQDVEGSIVPVIPSINDNVLLENAVGSFTHYKLHLTPTMEKFFLKNFSLQLKKNKEKQQNERLRAVEEFVNGAYGYYPHPSHYKDQPEELKAAIGDLITYAQNSKLIEPNGPHSLRPILERMTETMESLPENDERRNEVSWKEWQTLACDLTEMDKLDRKFDSQRKGVDAVFFALTLVSAAQKQFHLHQLKKAAQEREVAVSCFMRYMQLFSYAIDYSKPVEMRAKLIDDATGLGMFDYMPPSLKRLQPLQSIRHCVGETMASFPKDDRHKEIAKKWQKNLDTLKFFDLPEIEQKKLQCTNFIKTNVGVYNALKSETDKQVGLDKKCDAAQSVIKEIVQSARNTGIIDKKSGSLEDIGKSINATMQHFPEGHVYRNAGTVFLKNLELVGHHRDELSFDIQSFSRGFNNPYPSSVKLLL
jgi:hypothetical protein